MIDCLRNFRLVKSRGFVHLQVIVLGLVACDVALHNCQHCHIDKPYRDAQDRLL